MRFGWLSLASYPGSPPPFLVRMRKGREGESQGGFEQGVYTFDESIVNLHYNDIICIQLYLTNKASIYDIAFWGKTQSFKCKLL